MSVRCIEVTATFHLAPNEGRGLRLGSETNLDLSEGANGQQLANLALQPTCFAGR